MYNILNKIICNRFVWIGSIVSGIILGLNAPGYSTHWIGLISFIPLNLSLENGNDFIKKVLESDKQIIKDAIQKLCKIRIDIYISVASTKSTEVEKKEVKNNEEKNHPLLEDVIKDFKGKVIS